jgi:Bromodomain
LKEILKATRNDQFKTWEAFITAVEYLWENAKEYNEEDSLIHKNANKLKVCVQQLHFAPH